jgi:hypothetical protein
VSDLRKVLSALFMLSLVFAVPGVTFAADKDCDDFSTWEEAQRFFEKNGGPAQDPHRLDRDGDGLACEDLQGFNPNHVPGSFVKDDNKDSDSNSEQGSGNQNKGSDNSQGGQLPKTATPYPSLALSGMVTAVAGALLLRRLNLRGRKR